MCDYISSIEQYRESTPTSWKKSIRNYTRNTILNIRSRRYHREFEHFVEDHAAHHSITILCFHNVFTDELTQFSNLLNFLMKHFTFLRYSDAVARIENNSIDNRYMAVSFDDGYKNNVEASVIMKRLEISACFFVCPSIVGETCHTKVKEFNAKKLGNPPIEFMGWKDLENLLSLGHEIGNHTFSHCNIATLSKELLYQEIVVPHDILHSFSGSGVHFAWPYGKFDDFSVEAKNLVSESGHLSCSSAERGSHFGGVLQNKGDLCIRREAILASWPGDHVGYFLCKSIEQPNKPRNEFPANFI